jgi:hypothetical protein
MFDSVLTKSGVYPARDIGAIMPEIPPAPGPTATVILARDSTTLEVTMSNTDTLGCLRS